MRRKWWVVVRERSWGLLLLFSLLLSGLNVEAASIQIRYGQVLAIEFFCDFYPFKMIILGVFKVVRRSTRDRVE